MKNIIIVGSQGYNKKYGGWETFVTNLVDNCIDKNIKFHVTEVTNEKSEDKEVYKEKNTSCIKIYTKRIGFITMFIYTIRALKYLKKYIKDKALKNVTVYVLGCKVGPFYKSLVRPLKKLGAKIYLNPDGLEWKRDKWSWWIKICFKISEYCMVKHSDGVVCDSKAIKNYIDEKYKKFNKDTYFIAYGANLNQDVIKTKLVQEYFEKYNICEKEYYLIVGRFVAENNYELIIKEFMASDTKKDLVIVSNVEENNFYKYLLEKTHFDQDKRIKFIGSIYDKETLIYIRKNAYAYIHGHSVGGTNPSLLEALAITDLNILYNAVYNIEVGEMATLYFSRFDGDLARIIKKADSLTKKEIDNYGKLAKKRIKDEYTWDIVVSKYKDIFN